jgi:hypothetical protein
MLRDEPWVPSNGTVCVTNREAELHIGRKPTKGDECGSIPEGRQVLVIAVDAGSSRVRVRDEGLSKVGWTWLDALSPSTESAE